MRKIRLFTRSLGWVRSSCRASCEEIRTWRVREVSNELGGSISASSEARLERRPRIHIRLGSSATKERFLDLEFEAINHLLESCFARQIL